MSERKNIDRLFQEKFRDFEVTPDEKVWQNIETELKEKKKRRIIPLWWKLTGVAALLVIGLMIFNRTSGSGNPNENNVVITDPNETGNGTNGNADENGSIGNNPDTISGNSTPAGPQPNGQNVQRNAPGNKMLTPNTGNKAVAVSSSDAGSPQQTLNEKDEIIINQKHHNRKSLGTNKQHVLRNTGNDAVAATANKHNQPKPQHLTNVVPGEGIAANDGKSTNRGILPADGLGVPTTSHNDQKTNDKLEETPQSTGIAANDIEVKKDSAAVATAGPNALEELLNEKENKVTSREQKINRWQITSTVAPIYFSSVSKGSPLDSRFEGNRKSFAPSLSYGVGAKYAISKKFSIKSGVNAVALEYNTNDIVFFQTENARMIENVKPNLAGAFVQVETKPENNAVAALGRSRTQYNGEVNQKIGYVEVPVEMSYHLIDKKFGMELIGGLSTLILNRNEVSLVSPGLDMTIGEADNLNPVHFSTNVGVGFRYSFLKSFEANLEPMLKYQINTFSNDAGNFKPFFFGVYTGVSFKF